MHNSCEACPKRTTFWPLTPEVKDHLTNILVYIDSHILLVHTDGKGHTFLISHTDTIH